MLLWRNCFPLLVDFHHPLEHLLLNVLIIRHGAQEHGSLCFMRDRNMVGPVGERLPAVLRVVAGAGGAEVVVVHGFSGLESSEGPSFDYGGLVEDCRGFSL